MSARAGVSGYSSRPARLETPVLRYVLMKLVLTVPLLLGVTFAIFVVGQLTPGDPVLIMLGERAPAQEVTRLRAALGLDLPWYLQYVQFVGNLLQGDLGISYRSKLPVAREVVSRLPATLELAAAALVFAVALGLSMIVVAMLGSSMPVFWSGLLLILFFSLTLGWLPASWGASSAWPAGWTKDDRKR